MSLPRPPSIRALQLATNNTSSMQVRRGQGVRSAVAPAVLVLITDDRRLSTPNRPDRGVQRARPLSTDFQHVVPSTTSSVHAARWSAAGLANPQSRSNRGGGASRTCRERRPRSSHDGPLSSRSDCCPRTGGMSARPRLQAPPGSEALASRPDQLMLRLRAEMYLAGATVWSAPSCLHAYGQPRRCRRDFSVDLRYFCQQHIICNLLWSLALKDWASV